VMLAVFHDFQVAAAVVMHCSESTEMSKPEHTSYLRCLIMWSS